jgi:hypothetical protein
MHTPLADERVKENLDALVSSASTNSVPMYQEAMTELGRDLGRRLHSEISSPESTYVAFTVEDADYLARGLLEVLTDGDMKLAGVACFWNDSFNLGDEKITPILRKYAEAAAGQVDTLIIVKSIISSACVVKTNLTKLIENIHPEQIHIVAPVMFQGSEQLLKDEFTEPVSSKFKFFTFAIDSERQDNGNIVPGIGGSVYEKLGFTDSQQKNTYTPIMVKERRALHG